MTFIEQFKSARLRSTPLIAVVTCDPAATIQLIAKTEPQTILINWDSSRGLAALTGGNSAVKALGEACGSMSPSAFTSPSEALLVASKFPTDSITFIHNAHLFLTDRLETAPVKQAIWNLRDTFKQSGRTLVLLVVGGFQLPAELLDIFVLDEPLPSSEELRVSVIQCFSDAKLPTPSKELLEKSVEALSGLSAFTAEQVTMMSLSREGLSLPDLWEKKKQAIEQTPGLSVWRGGETFDDIGGVENVKKFLSRVLKGNEAPNCILFIDEIEKGLAGASGGDLSGTSQKQLGTFLSWMEDNAITGMLLLGPPGCCKSMIAKAAGNTFEKLTIQFDFSSMEASLVGESGKNLRQGLKVVDAVSNKKVLCIATCNSITNLPPELRRRFAFGTFFFDLPDRSERERIWEIYTKKYKLEPEQIKEKPDDNGWTGAEIKQSCNLSYRLSVPLVEASKFIVPISKSASEMITNLRQQAVGRFISASHPGEYSLITTDNFDLPSADKPIRRRMTL